MKVKVKYYGYLQEIAGKNEDEVKVSKAIDLIDLFDLLPSKIKEVCIINGKKVNPAIKIFKNGVEIKNMDFANTKVQDGDLIQLLPPIGGG
ncbi:MAG: MoaD family protein [Candidatus Bathyarchaeia archaeon]